MTEKRLFVDSGSSAGSVLLNWHGTPEQEFPYLAEAYHLTAKEACAELRKDPRFGRDGSPMEYFRAYPIIFLYRHALELYMKAVILVASPMLSIKGMAPIDRDTLLRTHSLDKLRQDLERVFRSYGWKWDLGTDDFRCLADFRKAIAELHDIDKGSYTFRYPLDTKGIASLEPNFRFNLFAFCDVLDNLFPVLEGLVTAAYEELQTTMQARAEAREYEMENSDCDRGNE